MTQKNGVYTVAPEKIIVTKWGEAADGWRLLQRLRANDPEKFRGIKTGLTEFDKLTDGIQDGTMTVIIAKNKAGKTALMLTIAIALAKHGLKVIYVTVEMTTLQLMTRVMSNVANIDMDTIRGIQMDEEDWMRADAAVDELIEQSGGIVYGYRSLDDMAKLMNQEDPDVVVFDYGQLLEADANNENEKLSKISHFCKNVTLPIDQETGMPEIEAIMSGTKLRRTIIAFQVDKESRKKGFKVTDASVRGSSAPGDDADYLMMLNDVYTSDGLEVLPDLRHVTLMGRQTGGGDFDLAFERPYSRFVDFHQNPPEVKLIV